MAARLLYFDLGNVLLFFDHRRACAQIAALTGADPRRVWEVAFAGPLQHQYEAGEISTDDFYATLCEELDARPPRADLARAASDIFTVNVPVKAIVAQLIVAGWDLGILSNTCEIHWQFCTDGHLTLLPEAFSAIALSYEVGTMKPDPRIFQAAAEIACLAPEEIFYVDDIAEHVAGAREVGFDAVQYTTPQKLARDLVESGIEFNY
jgi:FMN phosphatase YigB (HAD superfamily)